MSRRLTVAAAQLGPVNRDHTRADVVERLVALLHDAHRMGARLVVFPELALTTFFPRWYTEDQVAIDAWFETEMPSPATKPLFEEAARLGIGFCLGYAELATAADGSPRHFNTQILVAPDGTEIGRYRKVHLPGHEEHEPWRPFQHLERRYFDPGEEGFGVWRWAATEGDSPNPGAVIGMAICNDRRWPETYRMLGLQGCELVLIGYNTPLHYAPDPSQNVLQGFHNNLVMAAGAYQNGMFVVGVAKGGEEEGVDSLAQSQIIAPSGQVMAQCTTAGDEVAVATLDLDWCARYKGTLFDFDRYRRPEMYGLITAQKGVVVPPHARGEA
jgi:predicted amidohydrolase